MADPARRLATYEDLFDLPDNVVGEIIGGTLHTSPRPHPRHANATSALGGGLNVRFQHGDGGPGGWWILDEPELHLGDDILVPDIAGWRRDRMPKIPDQAYFDIAPDWVCEVLSPSNALRDRSLKLPIYARAKVAWVWLVDPIARSVEVFRLEGTAWVLDQVAGGDASAELPPFEAVALDLGRLWL